VERHQAQHISVARFCVCGGFVVSLSSAFASSQQRQLFFGKSSGNSSPGNAFIVFVPPIVFCSYWQQLSTTCCQKQLKKIFSVSNFDG